MTSSSTKLPRFHSVLTTGIVASALLLPAKLVLAASDTATAAITVPSIETCNFFVSTRALDLGIVDLGETASAVRNVTNEGDAPCQLMAEIVDNSGVGQFSLVSSPTFSVAPGGSAEVAVQFAPLVKGSDRRDELRIFSDDPNNPQQANIPLWGVGIVPTPPESCSFVVTDPDIPLDFGDVETSATATLAKTVTNNGSVACDINAMVVSATGQFTVASGSTLRVAPGFSADFSVTFAPVAEGRDEGILNLVSNDITQPLSVDIALVGNGVAPPLGACDFSVDPASLAFGSLTIGSSSTRSTMVTNNGGTACSLTALVAGSGEFTLATASSVVVAAGGTASVSVGYAPIDVGTDSGDLTLTDAVTAQTVAVGSSGSGVDVPAAVCDGIKVKAMWKSAYGPYGHDRRHHHGGKDDDDDDHVYGYGHRHEHGKGGSKYGQLFVIGRGERDGKFILSNADDPEQIIAERSGRTGRFLFRINERRLSPIPCRVQVDQPELGLCGQADLINAPADCGATVLNDHDDHDEDHDEDYDEDYEDEQDDD